VPTLDDMTGPGLATRPDRHEVPSGGWRAALFRPRRPFVVGAAVAAAIAGTLVALTVGHSKAASSPACTVVSSAGGTYTLTSEQAQNAAIIAAVAFKERLPDHAVTVALATSLQESGLPPLDRTPAYAAC
jgi:hypothetical protein